MPGTAKAAKLISFKLQEGKTQEEAIEALKAIMQHFTQQPGALPGTVMHHGESDTYFVFAPGESIESMKTDGRAMIASGVGDKLFSVVDPPTFKPLDCAILDV